MMKKTLAVLLALFCNAAVAQETPTAQRIDPPAAGNAQAIVDEAIVDGTFYTGNLNWIWQAGPSGVLSMRGYGTTANGGTITQATACLYSDSNFSRRFSATVSIVQGTKTIQAITFARDFPPTRFTCHALTGFDAVVAPGAFEVVVSYDKFDDDNVFAGLASTDAGQTFDVQIGGERPPYADGPQGPLLIRGVGIKYRMDENAAPPPPPPACVSDARTACLLNDRFKVTATWQTSTGSGPAQVMSFGASRAESDQSVFLWFFNAENFEIGIKMVDACAPPFNKYWAFVSGLTNQGFNIRIEDTQTGAIWTHNNPVGQLAVTRADNAAFECP